MVQIGSRTARSACGTNRSTRASAARTIAGAATGVVERDRILGPERVRPGDVVLAMESSGLHSNGYSLVRHVLAGVVALTEICHATGAREIYVSNGRPDLCTFVRGGEVGDETKEKEENYDDENETKERDDIDETKKGGTEDGRSGGGGAGAGAGDSDQVLDDDPPFRAWLDAVRAAGLGEHPSMLPFGLGSPGTWHPEVRFGSAHQMGSCRMSGVRSRGAVDARGKVYGVEGGGLYVADASVLPGASGVNPMVTVMAVADWISRGLVRDLLGKER